MPNAIMGMTHIYPTLTLLDSNAADVGSESPISPQAAGESEFLRNPAFGHRSHFAVWTR